MKKPDKILKAAGVGRMNLKYHAHALTLFAVFWSLPSGISIMVFCLGLHDGVSIGKLAAFLIFPAIHVWSIVAAVYYWITERKTKVTVLKTDGEVEF